jgi:hypothetical protein
MRHLDSLLLAPVTCPWTGEVGGGLEHLVVTTDGDLPVGNGQALLAHGCCLLKRLPKASGVMRQQPCVVASSTSERAG